MKIIALKETAANERRVSITPEVAKKLTDLGHQIIIEKDAGKESGFTNEAYEKAGATVSKDMKESLSQADVVTHVSPPTVEELKSTKEGAILISLLRPHANGPLLKGLAQAKLTSLSLEMIPRISRAQAMDVLSSQSNLSGYKAVIDSASEFEKAIPMMMTAAGTIAPAKVLVIGAGVAGLQAIATARRMGAIVSAFDVRSSSKEQVESLGATFVEVPSDESGDAVGGYAKEMSEDYKKRQSEKLADVLKSQDIVVTTALIPGKPAPILISAAMVKTMKPGSVIYDLAIENGGNCELSESNKVLVKHGVKILAPSNVPSLVAFDASQLLSRNIFNLLKIMTEKDGSALSLNMEDDIIKGSCMTHAGKVVHPDFIDRQKDTQ